MLKLLAADKIRFASATAFSLSPNAAPTRSNMHKFRRRIVRKSATTRS